MMLTPMALNDGTEISYRPAALVATRLQGHLVFAHAGGIWGAHAYVSYMPDDKLAIGLFTNTDDGRINPADLQRNIARIVLDLPHTPIADRPLSPRESQSYVGTYCLREFQGAQSEIIIAYDGSSLNLSTPAPGSQVTRLHNQGRGRFIPEGDEDSTVRFRPEKGSRAGISIDRTPEGIASGVRCSVGGR